MGVETIEWVRAVLSPPRFAQYVAAVGGDDEEALRLYWWNAELSAGFMLPLHVLEVALRNALHASLVAEFGRLDWWLVAPLSDHGRRKIVEAKATLDQRRVKPYGADDVVAQLSFGFWVSLLGGRYHRTLWVPTLHRVFPGASRRGTHRDYEYVVVLRNRIMHHEPIHHRHLQADHATIHRLLSQLSPEAAAEVASRDGVQALLLRRG